MRQWSDLRDVLRGVGARISLLEPVEGLPDLVFTANAAMIYRDRAIMAQFRHEQRRGEERYDGAWLAAHGFAIHRLAGDVYFEGAGDVLFCGETLFAGYRIRSDARSHQQIGKTIGCRVIPLELLDRYYYHLDTCFCPLAPGTAIYHPAAFDNYGRQALGELVEDLIKIIPAEAQSFAANAVAVGRTVVTNTGCPQLHGELTVRDFQPIETPLSEFVKAGGSVKCLTLRLDGEETAGWSGASGGVGQ